MEENSEIIITLIDTIITNHTGEADNDLRVISV